MKDGAGGQGPGAGYCVTGCVLFFGALHGNGLVRLAVTRPDSDPRPPAPGPASEASTAPALELFIAQRRPRIQSRRAARRAVAGQ